MKHLLPKKLLCWGFFTVFIKSFPFYTPCPWSALPSNGFFADNFVQNFPKMSSIKTIHAPIDKKGRICWVKFCALIFSTHRHLVLAAYCNTSDIILMISLGKKKSLMVAGGMRQQCRNVYEILYSVTVCGLSRVNWRKQARLSAKTTHTKMAFLSLFCVCVLLTKV